MNSQLALVGVGAMAASGSAAWFLRGHPLTRLLVAAALGILSSLAIHAQLAVLALRATFPEARVTFDDLYLSGTGVLGAIALNLVVVGAVPVLLDRGVSVQRGRATVAMGVTLAAMVLTAMSNPWKASGFLE